MAIQKSRKFVNPEESYRKSGLSFVKITKKDTVNSLSCKAIKNFANITFNNKIEGGAEVIIKWKNNNLKNI